MEKDWFCKKCGEYICTFVPKRGQRRTTCDSCKKENKRRLVAGWRLVNADKNKDYVEKGKGKAKKWSADYYLKNKSRILEKSKEYHKNNPQVAEKSNKKRNEQGYNIKRGKDARLELRDHYIISEISRQTGLDREDILNNPEIIEYKRMQIELYREKVKILRNGKQSI